jgi:TatD DNase family protein
MQRRDFCDTHAHLDYPDFEGDLPQVLERAAAAGITRVISVGTDLESSRRAVAIAERFQNVYAAVGWHPSHVLEAPADVRPLFRDLARHPKVVALGETGLDYYRLPGRKAGGDAAADARYKDRQRTLFDQHLELAVETGLNVIIHERESFDGIMEVFEPYSSRVRGVFHCFSKDVPGLERILSLNSIVSFTGILTFKNGENVRQALAAAPMGKFMLETDSPFLAPIPYRGKRCEPAFVKEISEAAAQVKACSIDELSAATNRAAAEFFRNFPGQ